MPLLMDINDPSYRCLLYYPYAPDDDLKWLYDKTLCPLTLFFTVVIPWHGVIESLLWFICLVCVLST